MLLHGLCLFFAADIQVRYRILCGNAFEVEYLHRLKIAGRICVFGSGQDENKDRVVVLPAFQKSIESWRTGACVPHRWCTPCRRPFCGQSVPALPACGYHLLYCCQAASSCIFSEVPFRWKMYRMISYAFPPIFSGFSQLMVLARIRAQVAGFTNGPHMDNKTTRHAPVADVWWHF